MGAILTAEDAAKRLKVSKGQFSKLINGKIRGVPRLKFARLGRRVLVREETLDEWLREVEACNVAR
jgi:excisionase family DNA binding protein